MRYLILLILLLPTALAGQVLYRQDFGGNSVRDDSISVRRFRDCLYRQIYTEEGGSEVGTFSVRKRAFYNGNAEGSLLPTASQWYAQADHTHPGDYTRGYFLQVDGSLENDLFYSFRVTGVHPGSRVEISMWVVNLYTNFQRRLFEERKWPVQMPDIDLIVLSRPDINAEIARFRIGPVPFDEVLHGHTDYDCSATWLRYTAELEVPAHVNTLYICLGNRVTGSPGNDFGIDDIEVRVVRK